MMDVFVTAANGAIFVIAVVVVALVVYYGVYHLAAFTAASVAAIGFYRPRYECGSSTIRRNPGEDGARKWKAYRTWDECVHQWWVPAHIIWLLSIAVGVLWSIGNVVERFGVMFL